ncbi:MAG: 6-hydroxymethyl-7,8-dihydropterin pyrophosphokinase [Thermoprotei archaeon]|nr:MAG: 6-hydroxymethyl-7,8-dihydropterin pyrophosphokinase [Thermoprotei archaeon]
MFIDKDWMVFYEEISRKLGFNRFMDYEATRLLSKFLSNIYQPIDLVKKTISGSNVFVFGAGPSLVNHIILFKNLIGNTNIKPIIISADGATRALLDYGITPDIVVSDFDGGLDVLVEAGEEGSILVLHGHGDNIDLIYEAMPKLLRVTKMIIGTTQVYPTYGLYNFGGFTDGDRAVYLATRFNAFSIVLAGMDFGDKIGRYSKPWMKKDMPIDHRKKLKLEFGKKLISLIACNSMSRIYSLANINIECVEKINKSFLAELI